MKTLAPAFLVSLIAVLLAPTKALGDGMFVVPKFVWEKHKDINEPTQKAIIVYDAGYEDLILQVKYEGPVDEFGWLIPVPNLPTVQKGSMKCFYELSQYTQRNFEQQAGGIPMAGSLGIADNEKPEPIKVIEVKTVGAYQIAVLSTQDSGALAKWLEANRFYFPTNKTDVLDAYIKQQWYFVAARINLSASGGFRLLSPRLAQNEPNANYSAHLKLASGELNPLQISFGSDRCVFPLNISSVNGKPSEVQVYVLSPEPLVEKGMFEEKQREHDRINEEWKARRRQSLENIQALLMAWQMHKMGIPSTGPLPPVKSENELAQIPEVPFWEVLPYGMVSANVLSDCGKQIPRLKSKSWWLTKQTWTFQPEKMRDLEFAPAIPVLAAELTNKAGYFAAANLVSLGSNAVPVFLAALESDDSTARVNAASVLQRMNDPRITRQLAVLLKDPQPEIRARGVVVAMNHWNPEFTETFVGLLRDKYPEIRSEAVAGLVGHFDDANQHVPAFQTMLEDTNPDVQASGLEMLQRLGVRVPQEELLRLCSVPQRQAVASTYALLQLWYSKISKEEAVAYLRNPEILARLIGLNILYRNADKQSIELALPLLKDPEKMVRMRAADTLCALTGQHFTEDQADQWQAWWTANKADFVVQQRPEELRLCIPDSPPENVSGRPSPAMLPENLPH